jgi:hypothetical protein
MKSYVAEPALSEEIVQPLLDRAMILINQVVIIGQQ